VSSEVAAVDGRDLAEWIREVPDFPTPGISFKDITPLLADPHALRGAVEALTAGLSPGSVDKVAGIEARGFVLGAPVALALGAGFVPVRKAGKLPAARFSAAYELEYGAAVLEVHVDAVSPGERVLVVDDVLATGGTVAATVGLVEQAGGIVVGVSVLLELPELGGRARVGGSVPIRAVIGADA
jgi:adenine phosphoribosyltransferase